LKKRFQKIIKDERGFGNHIESLVMIAIIGIIAAIAIPAFMNALEKSPTAKDVNCITTMIAIAQGSESTETTIIEDTQVSVSCPDPEAHLLSSPLIIGSDKGLIFVQTLPEITYAKSGDRDIADQTVLADLKKAVVVTEKMGWGGYLIVGLIILALLSAVIRSWTALFLDKNPGKGMSIASTWIIVCLIGGFFFHRSLIRSEYRFSKSDGTVSIHNRYVGEKFSDPEIFNDIVAIVPLRNGKERMSVAIFYETTEGIHHSKLFRVDNENLEIVSLLNHALLQGDTPIIKPVEPSAEQIETAQETKRSKEEEGGFFEMVESVLSALSANAKGNKPRQRYPAFIPKRRVPKPNVMKPQFKRQPWMNSDNQENLIKGQMEALRMQQQQQEQSWREAEAIRIQLQQQEQMWRQQLYYDQLRNQHNYHQRR
jgi:type II secretory pathway pseudopilin PulG